MKTQLPANLQMRANIENKNHFLVRPKKIQPRDSTQRNGKKIWRRRTFIKTFRQHREKQREKKEFKMYTVVHGGEGPTAQKCKKIVHPIREICQSLLANKKHVISAIVMQNVGNFRWSHCLKNAYV